MLKTASAMYIFMCILLLCFFSLALFFAPSQNITSEKPSQAVMVLGDFKGQLALFEAGNTEPVSVFDTYVSSLPPLDRQKLSKGIEVNNKEDLWALLQDFAQ